jgi:uncharacterized protein YchJ
MMGKVTKARRHCTAMGFRRTSAKAVDANGTLRYIEAGSTQSPGRNEVCPCGSGKKFKKCHGAVQ